MYACMLDRGIERKYPEKKACTCTRTTRGSYVQLEGHTQNEMPQSRGICLPRLVSFAAPLEGCLVTREIALGADVCSLASRLAGSMQTTRNKHLHTIRFTHSNTHAKARACASSGRQRCFLFDSTGHHFRRTRLLMLLLSFFFIAPSSHP